MTSTEAASTTSDALNISTSTNSRNTTMSRVPLSSAITATPSLTSGPSSSGDSSRAIEELFSLVLIASIVLAILFVFSLMIVFVCWRLRRKRTVAVNENRERKHRSGGLRASLKRTFFSDGPLYAVTNLHRTSYLANEDEQRGRPPDNTEFEVANRDSTDDVLAGRMSTADQITYGRYLVPVEGLPERAYNSSTGEHCEESTYLQPVHGIPVPDKVSPRIAKKPKRQEITGNPGRNKTIMDNALYDEVIPMSS